MSIQYIGSEIVTLLTPLLNSGKVKQIDQYASAELIGYPRIQVLSKGINTEYLTNVQRLYTYNFDIVITQEKTEENITPVVAEEVADLLIQEIVDIFNGQINTSFPLGASVDFIKPITVSETDIFDELPLIRNIIQLEAIKLV